MVCLQLDQVDVARRTIEAFAGQLDQNAESMSAMVQVAEEFVPKHGAMTVTAAPNANRVLKPAERAAQVVSIGAAWENPTTLQIVLQIEDGYHINANEMEGELIPTRLQVDRDTTVEYPPGRIYEGRTVIRVLFEDAPSFERPIRLALTYQACDESACLPPVTKQFELRNKD